MCNAILSPAKLIRGVKRMANFNSRKSFKSPAPKLSKTILPQENFIPPHQVLSSVHQTSINIPPKTKTLSIEKLQLISIQPVDHPSKRKPSNVKICSIDIPPDPLPCFYCNLVCPRPNLPPTPTRPIQRCSVCWKPIREDVEPMYCCNAVMHNLCWGDHQCQN